jgi:hypothetical protein
MKRVAWLASVLLACTASGGEIEHVVEQQRLCWGTADAHYALSRIALSADGGVLVVFHGGCSRIGTLGWVLRLSDGAYRRISGTRPKLPSAAEALEEFTLLYGQDDVFTLELSGTTLGDLGVRAHGLGRSFELELGPIRAGPKTERPADGLSVIR